MKRNIPTPAGYDLELPKKEVTEYDVQTIVDNITIVQMPPFGKLCVVVAVDAEGKRVGILFDDEDIAAIVSADEVIKSGTLADA